MTPLVFLHYDGCMPGRETLLVNGEIYHIVNRGVVGQPIFNNKRDYRRFLDSMFYYQNINIPLRFSKFLVLPLPERVEILEKLKDQKKYLIEFLSYCLMPNHFHLLLRQAEDGGISKFIGNLTNSYTRYFNTKNNRTGHLFQSKFKSVLVENDAQLFHVVRYIHLNPYSSSLLLNVKEISSYPYSSFADYLKPREKSPISKGLVLDHFRTIKSFEEFTLDQADYQKSLQEIKHLALEK